MHKLVWVLIGIIVILVIAIIAKSRSASLPSRIMREMDKM